VQELLPELEADDNDRGGCPEEMRPLFGPDEIIMSDEELIILKLGRGAMCYQVLRTEISAQARSLRRRTGQISVISRILIRQPLVHYIQYSLTPSPFTTPGHMEVLKA